MRKRYAFLGKNWLHVGLIATFLIFTCSELQAQIAPVKQWDKTFGANGDEKLSSFQHTADGGYILGGISNSSISGDKSQSTQGDYDYWIVKLDASGNKQWDKTYGGSDIDFLYCIKQTANGGYILGGISKSGISGDKSQVAKGGFDFWVIRLDASGNKIWDKTFGGANYDHLNWIEETSDGGFILGGDSESGISSDKSQPSQGGFDYWIIKLDGSGNKLWDKTFGGNYEDRIASIHQTADGGFIVGGTSASGISGDKSQPLAGFFDYWIIRLNSAGDKIWDKTLGGSDLDNLHSLQQTSDGGYILGGASESNLGFDKSQNSKGSSDYWLVKLDNQGNKTWDKTLGGNQYDVLFSLKQTSDGSYLLGGLSNSNISGDKSENNVGPPITYDYWLIKVDGNGNKIWDKTIGGDDMDFLSELTQTMDGGYVLSGSSQSGVSGNKTQPSKGGMDFWLIKLAPEILGINEPEFNPSISISPNPNQGNFTLHLKNITSPKTEITISDLLGRTILQQEFKTTSNQLSEEISMPGAKGIYLLQLKAGDQVITRKIVVE